MKKGSKKEAFKAKIWQSTDSELIMKQSYTAFDIMKSIQALLKEFDYTKYKFAKMYSEVDNTIVTTNIYPYFTEQRSANTYFLNNSLTVLDKIGDSLESEKRALFEKRKAVIVERVRVYKEQSKEQSDVSLSSQVDKILKNLDAEDIAQIFNNSFAFNYSDMEWSLWLCYACLHYEGQASIVSLLSQHPVPPSAYRGKLLELHLWETSEFSKLTSDVYKAKKSKKFKTKYLDIIDKYIIGKCTDNLQYEHKIYRFCKRVPFVSVLDCRDWDILSTYSLLCSAFDGSQIVDLNKEIICVLSNEDNRNINCPVEFFHKVREDFILEADLFEGEIIEADIAQLELFEQRQKQPDVP